MAASTSESSSKMEYLKKYGFIKEEDKKKKKKKAKSNNNTSIGVVVVDEDPVWQKPVIVEEEDDEAAEDTPQVDVDIEVKRMKRLEQIRSRRPFGSISDDGSGWISVTDTSKTLNSDDQIPDISPPRRRGRLDTPSPRRENGDLSPPRKQRARNDSPPERMLMQSTTVRNDLSPPRKRRAEAVPRSSKAAAADLSALRNRWAHHDSYSPEAVEWSSNGASADLSPPRKRQARNDSPSPEIVAGSSKVAVADLSPPRRRQNQGQTFPPPRRRHDTPSGERGNKLSSRHIDLSPPRKRRSSKGSPLKSELMPSDSRNSDLSPPHKQHAWKDSSSQEAVGKSSPPCRDRARFDSVSPRDKLNTSSAADLSPVRKPKNDRTVSKDHFSRQRSQISNQNDTAQMSVKSDLSSPRKHHKGTSISKHQPLTGLVTGQDVKEEIAKTQKADWSSFNEMDPSISGRGAEPVYRDKKTGKRMSKEEFLNSQKKEEKPKEIKLEWGKGLSQKREAEARLQELEEEKNKPFARSRDDPELDRLLKERVRWGDPMAHLVKKKEFEPVLANLGDDDKMKESGFIVPQDIPKHSWIKRGLDAAPNRHSIKPGRHWDGVDRSNGFEKAMFKRTNEKEATQREAYLWSVSDM